MFAFEPLHLMSMRKKGRNGQMALKLDIRGAWQSWVALNFQLCWIFFVCSVTAYLVWNQWNSIVFEGTMILYQMGHGFSVVTTAGTCSSTARYYNPSYVTVSRASNDVFLLSILGCCCVCSVKSSVGFLIFLMKFYYFYPKKRKIIKKATLTS